MADWTIEYNKDNKDNKDLSRSTPNLNTKTPEERWLSLCDLSRRQSNEEVEQEPIIHEEPEVDLGYVVKDNNKFLDEPNHTVDVSKESEDNLNNQPFPWTKDWEKDEQTFVRVIDVRLKNGETYIYDFDNIGELCLCELEDDTRLIFEYIKTLGKGNEWIELRNYNFEYSLVRVLDIAEVKVRYEEV